MGMTEGGRHHRARHGGMKTQYSIASLLDGQSGGMDVPYPETLSYGRYVSGRVLKDLVSKARQFLKRILGAT